MEPILFVHGLGGGEQHYQPIIKYLKEKGINNFYEFNYDNRIGLSPIKIIAKELAEFIDKNVKEEGITIIGLSQGGIIALAYMKYYPNKIVNKLFTICTPHKGSKLAKILNLPGIVDLRPSSKLLEELEVFVEESKTNIYSVYTPFDLMVFPGWNARSKFGKQKIVFAPTHPGAFSWPATLEFIYKNLLHS
ncbi:MAG: hypothetical protein NTV36_03295 [Candidatus Staskawiczbacteria bacterium]|nr:hypothetical protein [Candidatus Staskawiczbacteria bacterium]